MALEEYNSKRNFKKTPEPTAEPDHADGWRFVIQCHRASRLHYDLRLEMEGVLKSWAVPKGPSMNPKDKRLAVRTEDHPVKYLTFHGTIPKGNYGAGEMTIWDQGQYRLSEAYAGNDPVAQLSEGDLKIEFHGKKIKGNFALVHTARNDADNHWLLIKKNDPYATELEYDAETFRDDSMRAYSVRTSKETPVRNINPDNFVGPMLASSTGKIFNDKNWLFELKWDGYRMMAHIKSGEVHLHSCMGISYNLKFEPIARDLEKIEHSVILDGETVIVDQNGLPKFQSLQNYGPETDGTLLYYVFNMLYLNGHDMTGLKLVERKSLIPEVIEGLDSVRYCDHVEAMGTALYNRATEAGMEGVIAKKMDSTYSPGHRSKNWLKVKSVETIEATICGYTDSVGGGAPFGSLVLGTHTNTGWKYVGNCGSGFSAEEQRNLLNRIKELEIEKCPFSNRPNLKGRKPHWTLPQLTCRVKFSEWTDKGLMRHPIFMGLLEDKGSKINAATHSTEVKETSRARSVNTLEVDGFLVPLSNLDKVFWPVSGFTKYDLIDYYLNISEYILPYLVDRPQSLHRNPNGIRDEGFYQKDNENLSDWIETRAIHSKSSDRDINYLICQNTATLLYMANLGCIEIHPWNSRIGNLDHPDYTIIDLDPSEKNTFEEVVTVAQATKEVLDIAGIKGYCKTSGSRGLHIYIPLAARYSYVEARDFTKLLCYFIQEKTPKLTSMARPVKDRKDKIYLDYLQNRRGQTLASAYCARPRKGATVSTPLLWKEVKPGLRLEDFSIKTIPDRLREKGDIFKGVLQEETDIETALVRLEGLYT